MSDLGKLAFLVALGAAFNLVPTVQKGRDPVPVLAANVALFLALAALGALWRYDVSKGLAGLYLLSSFLIRGMPVVDAVGKLITGFTKTSGKSA